jgi:hypothetical protein
MGTLWARKGIDENNQNWRIGDGNRKPRARAETIGSIEKFDRQKGAG